MKQIPVALIIGISMIVSALIIVSGLKDAGRRIETAGNNIQSGLNAVSVGLSYSDDSDDGDLADVTTREIALHLKNQAFPVRKPR
ncbi:hypothetical protein LLG95_13730 [bacterium]|nr:hypothetical protein [bacterium]